MGQVTLPRMTTHLSPTAFRCCRGWSSPWIRSAREAGPTLSLRLFLVGYPHQHLLIPRSELLRFWTQAQNSCNTAVLSSTFRSPTGLISMYDTHVLSRSVTNKKRGRLSSEASFPPLSPLPRACDELQQPLRGKRKWPQQRCLPLQLVCLC